MCDKPVLMSFALHFIVSLYSLWIKLVTMSEFPICLSSEVTIVT